MTTLNHNFPGRVRIGVANGELPALLQIAANANDECEIQQWQFTPDSAAPTHDFRKARGSTVAPADAQINDRIIDIRGLARSTTYQLGPAMRAYVDGPGPLVAGQNPPSRIVFQTNLQNAASQEQMVISSDGNVGISKALFSSTERPAADLHVLGNGAGGADVHMHVERVSADASSPLFEGFKARGTVAARGNVVAEDVLATFSSFGFSNTYLECASVKMVVADTVVAGQRPASRIEFYSNANNAAAALNMLLTRDGRVVMSAEGTAAYLAGVTADENLNVMGNSGAGMLLQRNTGTSGPPEIVFRKAEGTLQAPTDIGTTQRLALLKSQGYSGGTYFDMARATLGVDGAYTSGQRPPSYISLETNKANATSVERLRIDNAGNIGINTTSFGASSEGVLGVGNRAVAPTGNPTAGGILYAESGAGKWRGSGGTTTTFGPADPHCPECGSDFGFEFERSPEIEPDPAKRYLAVCLNCLMNHLDSQSPATPKPWSRRLKAAEIPGPAPEVAGSAPEDLIFVPKESPAV